MQFGVHAGEAVELGLAQAAVDVVLDVVRGAVQLVDEAAEVAQQHLASGAQEGDAAAQLAAAGARSGHGAELVGVEAGGEVGDGHRLGRDRAVGRRCGVDRGRDEAGLRGRRGRGRLDRGRGRHVARRGLRGVRERGRHVACRGLRGVRERARRLVVGRVRSRDSWPAGLSGARGGRVRGSGLGRLGRLVAFGTRGAPAGQASKQAAHRSSGHRGGPGRSSIGSRSTLHDRIQRMSGSGGSIAEQIAPCVDHAGGHRVGGEQLRASASVDARIGGRGGAGRARRATRRDPTARNTRPRSLPARPGGSRPASRAPARRTRAPRSPPARMPPPRTARARRWRR